MPGARHGWGSAMIRRNSDSTRKPAVLQRGQEPSSGLAALWSYYQVLVLDCIDVESDLTTTRMTVVSLIVLGSFRRFYFVETDCPASRMLVLFLKIVVSFHRSHVKHLSPLAAVRRARRPTIAQADWYLYPRLSSWRVHPPDQFDRDGLRSCIDVVSAVHVLCRLLVITRHTPPDEPTSHDVASAHILVIGLFQSRSWAKSRPVIPIAPNLPIGWPRTGIQESPRHQGSF
jgi:hypothetical protein